MRDGSRLLCLLLLAVFVLFTSASALAQNPESESAAAIAPDADEPDAWYPQTRTSTKGSIVIHAPQIEAWSDFESLTAWIAFQITLVGSNVSPYGALHLRAKTEVDLERREVLLYDPEILSLSIPGLAAGAPEYATVREGVMAQPKKVPLDLVLEYLPTQMPLPSVEGLNPEPPRIFVSTSPALLVSVDSTPMFVPITGTELEFVLNTNWDLFRERGKETLYLRHGLLWLSAKSLDGPWCWASSPPAELGSLPDDGNWGDVRAAVPTQTTKLPRPAEPLPKVYTSTEPAELLLLDGAPRWENVGDQGLLFAANTEQELFRQGRTVYLLLSGRWFAATSLDGPWTLASELPDSFLSIPADHATAYVRKSVPGTREAWEAALVASIPTKAKVECSAADGLEIDLGYAGEPIFQPISGTDVDMAVNTSYQVLEHRGSYYLCYNAVWLVSRDPAGPWSLATSLPPAFKSIPPSSPAYNTTFVQIESVDTDSVTYSYTSGYERSLRGPQHRHPRHRLRSQPLPGLQGRRGMEPTSRDPGRRVALHRERVGRREDALRVRELARHAGTGLPRARRRHPEE